MPVIQKPTQSVPVVTRTVTWATSWWRWVTNLTSCPGVLYSYQSTGDPNGVVVGPTGAFCVNIGGGAGTTFYVKESSPTPSTGWVAK